ncbi:hypothetical protein [Stigmatella aurantiaca]|uniref:Uncharacterized protein n=1 Tax=Stigmatella aurantiaca (strain DW4/3-1) TaxID=378806 RepID=Q08Z70_STIAD|nr:hypothetical protein [Stigmatella aurantiaca]ADO72284.1 uncharacterized protein STAUR_4504 [Stigmatella aurantiaca DW4/3-1]EAU65784.1 hypothetical protein STIAU_6741 [Stigmatella aurantiaca DW4/3-1]
MAMDPIEKLHQREREQERQRLREQELKDQDVDARQGPRPLEGFAGGHTTWTGQQEGAEDSCTREAESASVEEP